MPRFLNIADKQSQQPSLVNVDTIARVHPGSCSSNGGTGRDAQCCIVLTVQAEDIYDEGKFNEPVMLDVFLPVKEIVHRLQKELLVI